MKGLLLKDFYMIKKYFRFYLILIPVFLVASFFSDDGTGFVACYPMILLAMVPMNLLAYDEGFKWDRYCAALPCSRAAQVSAKYVVMLCIFALVFVLSALVQILRIVSNGGDFAGFGFMLAVLFSLGTISPAISMPIIYKFGVSKGRVVSIAVFALLVAVSTGKDALPTPPVESIGSLSLIAIPVCSAIFAVSWLLSIRFYKQREI